MKQSPTSKLVYDGAELQLEFYQSSGRSSTGGRVARRSKGEGPAEVCCFICVDW
jgi:hypothetical protein